MGFGLVLISVWVGLFVICFLFGIMWYCFGCVFVLLLF